jgi:ABC-type transporter Mla subunit MlaD
MKIYSPICPAPAQPSARDVLNGRIAARNSAEDAKQINLAEQSEIFKKRVDDTKKRINDALAASKITKEKYNELMQTLNNAYQEAMHSGRGAERKYTEVIKEAYPISIGSEAERASNQAIQNLLGLSTTGAYNYNEVFNASGATIVDPAKAAKDAEKAKKKAEAEAKKNDQRIKTENSAVNAYIKQMDDLIKRDFPNMKSPERERIIASMLSIAKHESGLIPNNIQKDENGNPLGGYGLFQIDVNKGVYAGMPGQSFLDPTTNINAAYEGYFKKMIKKGGRSAADFYWMPGIGINSAATHGALDEELAKNEQDFLGLAKVSSTLIADDGKKGSKKTDTGDPFQHGLQLIQSGSQALKALSTNYNPSDVRNVEPFFDDMKQLAEAMANASDGIDDIINKADNIDAFTTLSLHAAEVISKGTDAFNKLYDLIPPQPEDFKRFFDANDTLIAYITDRSSNIAEDLPAQAETYVTVVGDALAVISQGVKDFNDLAMSYTVQPEQIDAFFTNIDATVERYKAGLGSVDKDLLDQSGQYLRVVSDASLTISKAADAFKNMWMGAMVDPAQIDAFINNLTQIIHRFGEAQSTLTPELERDAKNFSNTVGKVTSGVKTGVEALNALWTLYPIDTSSIDQFVGDVLTIVNKFSDAEKALGSDPAAKAQLRLSAQTFAKLTDEVTKPIKTGVDAINALWTMMPIDTNAVDQFTENIKLVAQKYNEGIKSLGGAGQANILVQTSTLFSQIVDSSTKGMSSGIDGLNKLWTLIKPDTQSVDAFVDSIIMVATKFAEVGPKVRPISLQAEEFAKVAQAVTGPIGSGVDNLSKVWRLEKPSEKQIDELTNSLFMVSDKFAQAMKRFTDQHDPQRAQQFATAAKAVTDVLAPTITGFESLRRYIKPKDGIFEAIADQLSSLTSAFADKAVNFQPSQLVQVKQFMDAAKPVIDAIKDFAELADKLRLYKSRSLPLAEIKEQMVGMFNLFADMFQDNENPTYSHTQLVQVMEFADANKKVMDAFTGAITTADKLMNYIKPNLSKMSGINELMKSAMSQMIGLMNGFDYGNEGRQGVEDAASFAEQMSKILGPIATSMDIANKLVDYIKPNENALKSVRQLMQREVQEFLLLAKDYPDGLDPQIEKFAQTIGAIFNPIKTAIDTFNALSDFVAPNSSRITAVISSIKSTLSQFLEELMPFADKLQQEGDRGKGLAALGGMLEVLSKGTGSLNQITDLVLPKPEKIQQSVTALHDTLLSVVPLMRQFASENMGGDNFSPEYFQKQMQATGSTLEVLVKGLAVFEKLNSLPNINRSTVDRLIADTQYAAKEVFQAVSDLINDNVDLKLTAKAADAASKSMDVLTKAIEAFSKLNSYVSPPTRLYHVIAQDIKMASTEIVAGLTGLDIADGMDKKISAASNSVKAIGDAIGVFMKLNDITDGKGQTKSVSRRQPKSTASHCW